jgi:hypothetical protein
VPYSVPLRTVAATGNVPMNIASGSELNEPILIVRCFNARGNFAQPETALMIGYPQVLWPWLVTDCRLRLQVVLQGSGANSSPQMSQVFSDLSFGRFRFDGCFDNSPLGGAGWSAG